MHISEGVLNTPILLSCGGIAVAGTVIGLIKTDLDRIMHVSLLTSTFFIASLIHVPLGPGSIHLVLNGLLGVILGWACFPAIVSALILQAVFFQFGGLTSLGANTVIMAVPAVTAFYLVRPLLRSNGRKRAAGAFIGGFSAILLSSLIMAALLVLSDKGFWDSVKILVTTHLPLMIVEGFITMFIVQFLAKVQPEILTNGNS